MPKKCTKFDEYSWEGVLGILVKSWQWTHTYISIHSYIHTYIATYIHTDRHYITLHTHKQSIPPSQQVGQRDNKMVLSYVKLSQYVVDITHLIIFWIFHCVLLRHMTIVLFFKIPLPRFGERKHTTSYIEIIYYRKS